MSATVSDCLLDRLHHWGVRRVYGYPGEGLNGIMGAFGRAAGRVDFVEARHAELAALMACAHAKFSGEVGVCVATSGPAAVQLLNGLYDAKLDHQGVLAIVSQQKRGAAGADYQQEIDLLALFRDVAHEFVQVAGAPDQVRPLVDRALQIARERRAVTCIIIPADLQDLAAAPLPRRGPGISAGAAASLAVPVPVPERESLRRAAEVLNAGKKVALLVGAGALHATDEIIAVAEALGAGIAKALLGKAAVPDDLPIVTGGIGPLGTQPSAQMMEECDTLLMIGSSFPYAEFLPSEGQARGVQIDIDPNRIHPRYPMEVRLAGDSKATLAALLPLLKRKTERTWQAGIEQNVRQWWDVLEARAGLVANPINPQRVFRELSPRLPDNAIITVDSGPAAVWYARDVRLRRGMLASLSGAMGNLGSALPYAIAAKHVYPDRPVIALAGDAAMQASGINGLIAISRMWTKWTDKRLVLMVLTSRDLNRVALEHSGAPGDPKYEAPQSVSGFPYAEFAKMLGLHGLRVDHPEAVGPAWAAALRSRRPVLLEMVVDPEIAALPPTFDRRQLQAYLSALVQGDPAALKNIKATMKQWWAGKFASSDARG